MYRWIVKRLTRLVLARLRRGETRWLLFLMADDVRFRFPGNHSWAADFQRKAEARAGLGRYVETGLQLHPHEVVVSAPPWQTIVCTLFTDEARDSNGAVGYSNEGMLFDRIRWGQIREHVSHEDTQRTAIFDQRPNPGEGARSAHA